MKVALAQFNPLIGDIEGNTASMRQYIASAAERGAELVVFSELSTVGYPPRDLLLDPRMVAENVEAVEALAQDCRNIAAVVGFARPAAQGPGPPLEDAAAVLADGKVQSVHVKALLPNYDVYDDPCYFRAGAGPACSRVGNCRFGVAICEDLWDAEALGRDLYGVDPMERLMREEVRVIINIAASGYQRRKVIQREELFTRQSRRSNAAILYVNQVGGNDEMIFDGGSCAVSPTGELLARAASFREDMVIVDTDAGPASCELLADEMARLAEALRLGLHDYVRKGDFRGVVVALADDLNSAVVATLAVEAVGSQSVRALALPGRDGSGETTAEVRQLAEDLGLALDVLPIEPVYRKLESLLGGALAGRLPEDEIHARVRANVLATCAETAGCLVLVPSSKSDLALGRCVPVGGAPGAMAPIGDLFERDVCQLAERLNAGGARIPGRMLAGARETRTDERLGEILRRYIEKNRLADPIVGEGFDAETVRDVIRRVDCAEYKRKQAPVVLKVTSRAFGAGRRMPVARRYAWPVDRIEKTDQPTHSNGVCEDA